MRSKAFTLIELLVVVAIIGILAAVGVVAYNGYTSAAKKQMVWKTHSDFITWVNSEYIKCVMDENTKIELRSGSMSGGFSPIYTPCSDLNDHGTYTSHTNNLWKLWYDKFGYRNPFGSGMNGDMGINHGDTGDWCKTRMSRCAGYNDYSCLSATDCKLCGYDGDKIKCTKFQLKM